MQAWGILRTPDPAGGSRRLPSLSPPPVGNREQELHPRQGPLRLGRGPLDLLGLSGQPSSSHRVDLGATEWLPTARCQRDSDEVRAFGQPPQTPGVPLWPLWSQIVIRGSKQRVLEAF